MKFQLTPQRSDAKLAISVSGETAIINGVAYDLSPLIEGQSISFGAGSAKRDNGITVSLPLPYPHNPSIDPMQVYEVDAVDGKVAVPGHDAEQPAEIVPGVIDWPAPVSIDSRRAAVWEKVKAERTRRVNGGAQVSGHWYHTDVDSRVQHMRLDAKASALLAGGGSASDILEVASQPVYWKTLSNGLVPMTAGLAQAIPVAIEVLDALAFARAETLRAQIEVSENPEAIDITGGWPAIYEGAEE